MILKSKCLKDWIPSDLYLCDESIQEVERFKYLRHHLDANLKDDRYIFRQCESLYVSVQSDLWIDYKKTSMYRLMVAYHNVFRFFIGYSKRCSASEIFAENNVPSIEALIKKHIFNFIDRINNSINEIIMNINQCDSRWCSNLRHRWNKGMLHQLLEYVLYIFL